MPKLDLTRRSRDFLNSLGPKQFRQVVSKIFQLMEDPFPPDSRRLVGFPYHRADIGEYRIVYSVDKDTLRVALAGKRNDEEVYRQLSRLM